MKLQAAIGTGLQPSAAARIMNTIVAQSCRISAVVQNQ
jgi:hypothetical protein